MSYIANPVVIGFSTKKADYDALYNNVETIRISAGVSLPMGGDYMGVMTDIAYAPIFGAVHVPVVNGPYMNGLLVEVHFMAKVDAGTGSAQVYNLTDADIAFGAAVNFVNVTPALVKIQGLAASIQALAVAEKRLYLRAKGAAATDGVSIWGARLVYL